MRNPNWIKQPGAETERCQADPTLARHDTPGPVTEDELEALRYRGTAIHRPVWPVLAQPLPAPHRESDETPLPGGPQRADPDPTPPL